MEILEYCGNRLNELGLSKSGSKFEVFYEKSRNLSIEVQDLKVDALTQSTDQGLSIRTLKNGHMGFAYTFDLSKESVDQAIKTALEVGELMTSDSCNDLTLFSNHQYKEINHFDQSGLKVPLEEKIEIARNLEINAKKYSSKIKRVRKAGFDESEYEILMLDTHGKTITQSGTTFVSYLTCVAEENGAAEMGSDAAYGVFLSEIDHSLVSKAAAINSCELLGATKAPTMNCPAIFKNSVIAQLLSFLSGSFSVENVDKNFSLLTGKLSEKVFSEKFCLTDDALLPKGIATSSFDGSGIPCQTTPLVTNGVVSNFLYDSYYAKKHKRPSTGSSRRGGIKSVPSIGASNLILSHGSKSFDELTRTAHKGIYITNVLGLHTANPITGDFSLGASGILIENGKLSTPVKGFAIAGNILKLLSDISEIGSDVRNFGSVRAPSILFNSISVGGA